MHKDAQRCSDTQTCSDAQTCSNTQMLVLLDPLVAIYVPRTLVHVLSCTGTFSSVTECVPLPSVTWVRLNLAVLTTFSILSIAIPIPKVNPPCLADSTKYYTVCLMGENE